MIQCICFDFTRLFITISGRNWASLFVPMIMAGKVSDITTMPALNALDCQSPSTFIKLPSPRLIQNHLPVDLTPSDIFRKKCKILLICRNPKDVITSFYHHSLVLRDMYHVEGEPPFSDYFEISIQGKGYNPVIKIRSFFVVVWILSRSIFSLFCTAK